MNLSALIGRVRTLLNEPGSSFISDDDIIGWLNEAQAEACRIVKPLTGTMTADLVAGQESYGPLPDDLLGVITVTINGDLAYPYQSIREFRAADENDKGHQRWVLHNNSILLKPKPNTTVTRGLVVDYYEAADELSQHSDEPFNGQFKAWHYVLIPYAVAKGREMDSEIGLATPDFTQFYTALAQWRRAMSEYQGQEAPRFKDYAEAVAWDPFSY